MPVLGHAFVGLALSTWIRPKTISSVSSTIRPLNSQLWVPLVVALSYAPDIGAQLILLTAGRDARSMTHSVLFAVIVAIGLAPVLSRIISQSVRWSLMFVLGSVLLHDVLDLIQATDRVPWWPFSRHPVGYNLALFPSDLTTEGALFGSFTLFACGIRTLLGRNRGETNERGIPFTLYPSAGQRLSSGVVVLMMLVAAGTHYLRDIREAQLEKARILSQEQHVYDGALAELTLAERWPSTAKPGRIDYLRAWTYQQLGDRRRAEKYYLRAYHADPTYFWIVADLLLFSATSDEPLEIRRRSVNSYLLHLRQNFSDHPEFCNIVAKAEQALIETKSSPTGPLPASTQSQLK